MLPESNGATPSGRITFALSTAAAGSQVTVWVMIPGLVHLTVSPTFTLTVAGEKMALGLLRIETSTVLPCARAGVATVTPRAAMDWVKARRCIGIVLFS